MSAQHPVGARDRAPWVVALAALVLFASLTPRAPGAGDSSELTLALALTGLPHPTGYPLYVLVGSAVVRLLHALGLDWTRAAATWSALGGAAFAGLLVALGAALAPRGLARWLPAVLVALHPVTFLAATEAEVHTWWYAWCALAAGVALGGLRGFASDAKPGGRGAFLWGAVCGAGLAHHAGSVAFVLPLTLALGIAAQRARALTPGRIAAFALGAALPLASYGFVAWRAFHPAAHQWPVAPTLAGVLAHVRGAAYGFYVGGWAPSAAERTLILGTILPVLIPGFLALAWWAFRDREPARRAWFAALLASAALLCGFVLRYGVPDPARYFLPAAMAGAPGLAAAFAALERRSPIAVRIVLIAATLGVAWWSLRLTFDENRRRVFQEARLRAGWRAIPFERALVMWTDDRVNRLRLWQLLDGERAGLVIESPNELTWPGPRRRFHERFGLDPFAGFTVTRREDLGRLTDHLRGRVGIPVLDFNEVLDHSPGPDAR